MRHRSKRTLQVSLDVDLSRFLRSMAQHSSRVFCRKHVFYSRCRTVPQSMRIPCWDLWHTVLRSIAVCPINAFVDRSVVAHNGVARVEFFRVRPGTSPLRIWMSGCDCLSRAEQIGFRLIRLQEGTQDFLGRPVQRNMASSRS